MDKGLKKKTLFVRVLHGGFIRAGDAHAPLGKTGLFVAGKGAPSRILIGIGVFLECNIFSRGYAARGGARGLGGMEGRHAMARRETVGSTRYANRGEIV
jgi:hypothetical protein